jgi:hypothetical protein
MILIQYLGPIIIFLLVCQTCLHTFHPLVSPSYVNPSFGSGDMMPPYSPFSFGGSHILQPTLTMRGWNIHSHGSNPSFNFPGASAQMGVHSTYYILSIYPPFAMSAPLNDFPMADLHLSSGVSFGGSHFYSMGNTLHRFPSSEGNIYPQLSNPCHVAFSLKVSASMRMPLQPFMNNFRGGYYPIE